MTVYLRQTTIPKCTLCGVNTDRFPTALYCWECKQKVDTENRHKREKKKARAIKKALKKPA